MRFKRILLLAVLAAVILVPAASAMAFEEGYNPVSGIVGTPYNWAFRVYGGCPPYDIVVKSGSLPPGLSLSSSGTISGTPTTAGTWSFWAELRDTGCGPSATCPPAGTSCSAPAQRPFSITITQKLTVTTPSPLSPATVGVPYALKLTADGGGSQTWSVASGTLPAGLALAADGTLSGTPTAATPAPVSVVVKVTDGSRTDTKTLVIDVVTPLAVTAPALRTGEVGQALRTTTLAATGGRTPYAWTIESAPAGVALDPTSGALSGTPTAPGSFPLKLTVKDAYGTTASVDATLVVKAKLAAITKRLAPTKVGKTYRFVLRTNGGVAPFTWKVASGKFPVGIRLNRATGVLSGTPRKAGTFPLTFVVRDSYGLESTTTTLVLTVSKAKKKAAA
jgi:hypothetical protein